MLKEIPGACTQHEAEVITGLTAIYPVTVEVTPYTPHVLTPETAKKDTRVTIRELQEGVIGAKFFGDMYNLLQEYREPVVQEVTSAIAQPVVESVPVASPLPDEPTLSLWSRLMLFLNPDEHKQLTHSDQGAD